MYLVLTAMLALNVSAAILNGYTQVDDSLHATIDTMQDSNAETYATFKAALDKNPEKTQERTDRPCCEAHRAYQAGLYHSQTSL